MGIKKEPFLILTIMENRIKEQQLDLFADRTSTQTFQSNQLRLWFSSMAYVILNALHRTQVDKVRKAVDGFPVTEWVDTANNGKQKRHRSLQQFQSYFGLSRRIEQSGDKEKLKWFNSRMMRSHFYIWCMTRICPSPPRRLDTEIGDKLGAKWDTMKGIKKTKIKQTKKAKGKDAIIRLCFYATRLLFNELKHTIVF